MWRNGFTGRLFGDEGKLPSGVSSEDPATARPVEEVEWSAPIVADERDVLRRGHGAIRPPDAFALGAPLGHAGQLGDQVVDRHGRRCSGRATRPRGRLR